MTTKVLKINTIIKNTKCPIGVFDSGLGGLTVYKHLKSTLPDCDFIYLGDHARAPYGSRSFETIYEYTLNAVRYLFDQGCHLVILACNTASARALRTLQQEFLPNYDSTRRILGVIIPMAEYLAEQASRSIGILATPGTVRSNSYEIELKKLSPYTLVKSIPCPMLVPLIENNELNSPPVRFFIEKYLAQLLPSSEPIDTLVLGCTHYPLIKEIIQDKVGDTISIVEHGPIVALKLIEYFTKHPDLFTLISRNQHEEFLTTDDPLLFQNLSDKILDRAVKWQRIHI